MKYQVMRIEEDLDFGCEERGADEPVMAVVVLKDENGTESRIRQEDQMLYDWNIEEGEIPVDPTEAVRTAETLDAARVSAREGRAIAV